MSDDPSRAEPGGALGPAAWARLAEDCRRRDHRAFEQLVALTQDRLRRLVGRLVGPDGDLDELVQETYLRAWRGAARFRGESSLTTWLTRIAVNVALNWRRDRRPVVSLRPEHIDRLRPAPATFREESVLEAYERALAGLAEELRTTFVLHETEGLSYREIAAVLGCPIGTVMSRLHRAREQLMDELRERLEELTP